MEERKTIIDYIEQVMEIFGFSIFMLNIFCLLFGEDARGFSSMFVMGKEGLCIATMMQFLSMAVWIVLFRFLFFTDVVIKNMRVVYRACGMITSILVIMVIYVSIFRWFPANDWIPWVMFFICFLISFAVSLVVTGFKERMENKRMEEALQKLKKKESAAESK